MADHVSESIAAAAAALKAAGAREVYVFGSAAKGTLRGDSDIDLAVSGLPPRVFFHAMGAAHDALKKPLDLVDLDQDNPFCALSQAKRGDGACGMTCAMGMLVFGWEEGGSDHGGD